MPGRRRHRLAEALAVATLLAAAAALRLARLDLGWFGVDQARDIAIALDLAAGDDLPALGPTMRRVIRLGAFYHYFWAVPHLITRDPMAAYRFAALLSLAALLLIWGLARRLWGGYAATIALAVGAAHPVWIVDGRVAWAPAALPAAAALILWLVIGGHRVRAGPWSPPNGAPGTPLVRSPGRAALLGAALGLAVQLHLAMAAWAGAVALVLLLDRTPRRALLGGLAGALLAGLPALWALAAAPDQGGLATLASRGPRPDVAARLVALAELPARIPGAFSRWPAEPAALPALGAAGRYARVAALVVAAAALAGLLRLLVMAAGGARPARALLAIAAVATAAVVGLPGEVWYYYADPLLPLWALAVAAAVAPASRATPGTPAALASLPPRSRSPSPGALRLVAGAIVLAACAVLAVQTAIWLRLVAWHGYAAVEPALLTLDGAPSRDAPVGGRLLSVGVKRAAAAAVASGAAFEDVWRRTHGPAFGDATGDNGFWLRWYAVPAGRIDGTPGGLAPGLAPAAGHRHAALFYRDDPLAIALAAARGRGVELETIGPLALVRHEPAIDYETCRGPGGAVAVPLRALPHPRRYGDGTPERAREVPRAITCALAPGAGRTRVVAALDGPGTVRVIDAGGAAAPAGRVSALCLARGEAPAAFTVAIDLAPGDAADLDVYDVPLGVGCPP